ncbi:MAG: LysE family transporter [Bacteroidales bacterium]|jgi:threonine/homoserine/homoserine lactone efflux protein
MISIVLKGLLFGLGLSILIGPVFFALIHTSIKRGFSAGFAFAFGIFLSDLTCIFLSNLGLSQFAYETKYKIGIGVTGGIIMILFGIYEFFYKDKIKEDVGVESLPPKKIIYILKAFVLNTINPFVIIFWLTASGIVHTEYDSSAEISVFFLATLCTAISTDTLKAFIANKTKFFLTQKFLSWVHRISGILLILFGIILICRVFLKLA